MYILICGNREGGTFPPKVKSTSPQKYKVPKYTVIVIIVKCILTVIENALQKNIFTILQIY